MQKDKEMFNRRRFIRNSSAWAGFAIWTGWAGRAPGFESPNQRPRIGTVGVGSRWDHRATGLTSSYGSGKEFPKYGDIVAVCDVDADRRERASALIKDWSGNSPDVLADYRQIIDRDDIDVVHISTPDHWHAKVAIEAMLSGKDVYCEKPMTLTIQEGRQMCDVCRRTGRIVQVGTQQRSDEKFLKAIAMIRDGRIGNVKRAVCSIGGAPTSPKIPAVKPSGHLDWNQWLGPAPQGAYRYLAGPNGETKSWSRCHYEFRWWYEYSGGKLTDWGAHHVDIATWAMGKIDTGPISVDPVMVKHAVPFQDGYPTVDDQYNTATEFEITADYADGMKLTIRHDGDNGILFEGTEGRIFINRGRLRGKPVEELAARPLPDGAVERVYKDRPLVDHFRNFFEAVEARKEPVSDVFSHHRALTTCHLAGIAARLGRKIQWDPKAERIVGDEQSQSFVSREKRHGFEIET
jgi:predicted dehydrogenase